MKTKKSKTIRKEKTIVLSTNGGVKFATFLYNEDLTVFIPSDKELENLLDIENVEEVSSSRLQPYKVVFSFDSIFDINADLYGECCNKIATVLKRVYQLGWIITCDS